MNNLISNNHKKVAYCRVSSEKFLNDLEYQKKELRESYPNHELITDIGNGFDLKKEGIQKIIDLSMKNELEEVVVSYKDRLSVFNFDLLELFLSKNNTNIVVLNKGPYFASTNDIYEEITPIVRSYTNGAFDVYLKYKCH